MAVIVWCLIIVVLSCLSLFKSLHRQNLSCHSGFSRLSFLFHVDWLGDVHRDSSIYKYFIVLFYRVNLWFLLAGGLFSTLDDSPLPFEVVCESCGLWRPDWCTVFGEFVSDLNKFLSPANVIANSSFGGV